MQAASDYLVKHRWLMLALDILAIPLGLSLMWFGRQWFLLVTQNTQDFPDTGGHWLEFLAFDIFGIMVLLGGCAVVVGSSYALIATKCYTRSVGNLPLMGRRVVIIVATVSFGLIVAAVAIGLFLLLLSAT